MIRTIEWLVNTRLQILLDNTHVNLWLIEQTNGARFSETLQSL